MGGGLVQVGSLAGLGSNPYDGAAHQTGDQAGQFALSESPAGSVFLVSVDPDFVSLARRVLGRLLAPGDIFPAIQDWRDCYLRALSSEPTPAVLLCDLGALQFGELSRYLHSIQSQTELRLVVSLEQSAVTITPDVFRMGAEDVLFKPVPGPTLGQAVASALLGSTYAISKSKFRRLRPRLGHEQQLTPREFQVCRCIASGLTNKEIADLLQIALRTVKLHRQNVMAKLGADNLAHLLAEIKRQGF